MAVEKNKIPKAKQSPVKHKNIKTQIDPSLFLEMPICWRIGNFDAESNWGINSLKGKLSFNFDDDLLEIVMNSGDEELYKCLDELRTNEYKSYGSFLSKLHEKYTKHIEPEIAKKIIISATYNFFTSKIYPKLTEFENRSWKEIDQDRFGTKGKSKHHNISIEKLSEAAKKRLREKGYTDINDIYSLRLEGKLRIFGFRKQNYLDILWVDPEHEVCPVSKD